ncbi:NTTRR-F1 domain [Neobacillus niacini]|uniref:NTTRR-F1 domain n=1 Tax=Neobacillus niacini TaxID=86668 RepID=UPI003B0183E0
MIDNRIVNGGFETGTISPFSGLGVSIRNTMSHSGNFSIGFTGGSGTFSFSQLVNVTPGETFEFLASLAKINSFTSPPISINISYLDSSNNTVGTALTITIPSGRLTNNWVEVYGTTSPAPSTARRARVLFTKQSQSGSATVVVDDVALLAVNGGSSGPIGDFTVGGNLAVNGSAQLGSSLSDLVNVAGSEAIAGDLFVGGTTLLGNTLSDIVEVRGNETVQGNLSVGGNTTIQGELTVNGNTNFTIDSLTTTGDFTVGENFQVNGGAEFQGITSFFGPFTVFVTTVYADNNLIVGGSGDVIGSGSIQGGTLELSGFLGGGVVPDESLRVQNGHIAILGTGQGIILTAPNNSRWLVSVNNSGNLITTPVS